MSSSTAQHSTQQQAQARGGVEESLGLQVRSALASHTDADTLVRSGTLRQACRSER